MSEVTFRYADEADTGLVLEFIKGIAAYEKMSDEVVATEELLHEWMFEKKLVEVIFAEAEQDTVGFALFFQNFSTFVGRAGLYLEDIFVKPEYRKKGYGKAIFQKLAQIAVERGCQRFEWVCLDWEPFLWISGRFTGYPGMESKKLPKRNKEDAEWKQFSVLRQEEVCVSIRIKKFPMR